jgi:hypothetical protein
MKLHITLDSERLKPEELKRLLEGQLDPNDDQIVLDVRKRELIFRGLDPNVLVAIVAAAGTALGALITGVVEVAKQTSAKTIVIQSKNGSKLEFPAHMPSEEIDKLIEKVKKLDEDVYKILLEE